MTIFTQVSFNSVITRHAKNKFNLCLVHLSGQWSNIIMLSLAHKIIFISIMQSDANFSTNDTRLLMNLQLRNYSSMHNGIIKYFLKKFLVLNKHTSFFCRVSNIRDKHYVCLCMTTNIWLVKNFWLLFFSEIYICFICAPKCRI